MPETFFRVRWPDRSSSDCYSPSSTIKDVLALDHPYAVDEFVASCRSALEHGSERVKKKYGFGCGHALAQIREIEARAVAYRDDASARITVESFDP